MVNFAVTFKADMSSQKSRYKKSGFLNGFACRRKYSFTSFPDLIYKIFYLKANLDECHLLA